jgi:hypothetical protein
MLRSGLTPIRDQVATSAPTRIMCGDDDHRRKLAAEGRGEHWQQVCQGSAHPDGGVYTAENTWRPILLPTDVLDLLHQPAEPSATRVVATGLDSSERFALPEVIPEGARGDTLFRYARSLEGRGLSSAEALPLLCEAWERCQPAYTERTPESMWEHVLEYRQQPERIELAPGVWVNRAIEEWFWTSRRTHVLIRDWAHARLCSPHALLVAICQRVLASVPPYVVLPPIIRSDASLNLFSAFSGTTATGKDGALDVAGEVLQVTNGMPCGAADRYRGGAGLDLRSRRRQEQAHRERSGRCIDPHLRGGHLGQPYGAQGLHPRQRGPAGVHGSAARVRLSR